MTDRPENPPAFPLALPVQFQIGNEGMTLRDYFAGQALRGIVERFSLDLFYPVSINMRVEEAYAYADAMLAERTKP